MIKCIIKFFALHRAILRQENKAHVTVCSKITHLDIHTPGCLTKSKMLPRIWHIVVLLIG